jgi:transcriptional regulator with XRE-family HTH domain
MAQNWENYRPYSRTEIGKRLELTRRALGHTTTEMCKLMGSATNGSAWTNYETGRRRMSIKHALRLVKAIPGLSLDWIYRDRLHENSKELRDKIIDAKLGRDNSASAGCCGAISVAPTRCPDV